MSRDEGSSSARSTGPIAMRLWLAGSLLVTVLAPCPIQAQTSAAKAAPPSNRYLLIVDTSRSMQRRKDAVLKAVQNLLASGMNGQLRAGDTLGVWTFNESLFTGRFPLQRWSPEATAEITSRTLAFLKTQKYEKQANFDKVLPPLNRLINDSQVLTMILVSSGDEKMRGTPFDDRINAVYQQWHEKEQKARMPFVTVLRASNGQLADFTVSKPPGPTQMPRLVQETHSAEITHSNLLEALHTASPPAVPPLIISGKKAQAEKASASAPKPPGPAVEAPAAASAATGTNQAVAAQPPKPAAPPTQVAKVEPALLMPEKPAAEVAPKPSPAPVPVTLPNVELATGPENKAAEPAPTKVEVAAAPAAPVPGPATATVEPPKPAPALEIKQEPAPAPEPVTQPKVETVKGSPTKPVEAAPAATQATPIPPSPEPKAIAVASEPPKTPAVVEPKPAPAPAKSAPSSNPASPGQTATAVPAETLARSRNIWILGLILIAAVGAFAFLLLRRARATPQASLITQSFERKNKP